MKILFYTSVLSGGGAERVLCQLANRFSINNDVILVASYKTSNEYLVTDNVKKVYIDVSIKGKSFIRQIKNLRKLIKNEEPDVLVSFLPHPNFKILIASLGLKTRKVISVRNDPNREYNTLFKKVLASILYRLADGMVFQTPDAKKWFPKSLQAKSRIIMNQVDNQFFETEHILEEYYVATGRLNQQKNYPMMIRAFARFLNHYPEQKLYIYGDGKQDELVALINKLNVGNSIFLNGPSSDIPSVLSKSKCFILSSDYEGMPNGLLEALAMGVCCISTDCPCGGPKMVIEDGVNGFLIPVGDEDKLFDVLCMIESNAVIRNQISNRAKEKATTFKPEYIFKQWDEYINEQK